MKVEDLSMIAWIDHNIYYNIYYYYNKEHFLLTLLVRTAVPHPRRATSSPRCEGRVISGFVT